MSGVADASQLGTHDRQQHTRARLDEVSLYSHRPKPVALRASFAANLSNKQALHCFGGSDRSKSFLILKSYPENDQSQSAITEMACFSTLA
jgi:hypothetical protein